MNLINELGPLALATRMQRLSDTIRKDTSLIYEESGIAFESKWFPVIYVLSKKAPLGVVELATELGYAHPSVIALVKELQAAKLVKSVADKTDGRKRLLSLTPKANEMLGQMKPVWDKLHNAAGKLVDNKHNLLKAIEEVERLLLQQSFYERVKNCGVNF